MDGLRSPCLPATYQHASATLTSLARHISPSLKMPATLKRASNIHVLSFFNDVIASLCQRAARGSEVHLTAGCEMQGCETQPQGCKMQCCATETRRKRRKVSGRKP